MCGKTGQPMTILYETDGAKKTEINKLFKQTVGKRVTLLKKDMSA